MGIIKQLLIAVRYLHDRGIAHRDISLENVLLTDHPEKENAEKEGSSSCKIDYNDPNCWNAEEECVRLMDFGVACSMYSDEDLQFQKILNEDFSALKNEIQSNGGNGVSNNVNNNISNPTAISANL